MNTLFATKMGMDFKKSMLINTHLKNHRIRVEFMGVTMEQMCCDICTQDRNGKPFVFVECDAFNASSGWYLFPYWNHTKKPSCGYDMDADKVLEFINAIAYKKFDNLQISE